MTSLYLGAAFVGHAVEYAVETAAGELFAIAAGMDALLPLGASVWLILNPSGMALVE